MHPFPGSPDDWHDPVHEPPVLTADELIAELVAASIMGHPYARGRSLDIQVQNQVVILLGQVASVEARAMIRGLAWQMPGVRDVCNRLTVGPP